MAWGAQSKTEEELRGRLLGSKIRGWVLGGHGLGETLRVPENIEGGD